MLEHVAQLHRLGPLHASGPRVFLEPAHGSDAVGGALVDHGQRVHELAVVERLARGQALEQHLRPAEHGREAVVDVVRDARGQRAERAELLLTDDAKPQLVLPADVAEDADALDAGAAPRHAGQADEHGPRLARARDQQHLAFERGTTHPLGERGRVLRGGEELRPAPAAQRLRVRADHLRERGVGEADPVVGIGDDHALADAPHDVREVARLGFEPRVLERDGHTVGDDAQEPVRPRIEAPRAPADLEHSDRAAADDERCHHQRANAERAHGVARHPRVLRGAVLDQHGCSRAHRDALHALRRGDGELGERGAEAHGRARAQLASPVVGEEQGGDVGAEDLSRDLDDALQEDVRGHRGQARLRDLAERVQLARASLEEPAGDERARPGEQLLRQERLRHVVVGAVAQAANASRGGAQRAEHEHGNARELAPAAKTLDHVVAAHAWQHEVEDEEVDVGILRQHFERVLAGERGLDRVAFGLEEVAQQRRGIPVVLDDENARGLDAHPEPTPCRASVAWMRRAMSSGENGFER